MIGEITGNQNYGLEYAVTTNCLIFRFGFKIYSGSIGFTGSPSSNFVYAKPFYGNRHFSKVLIITRPNRHAFVQDGF